MMSEQNACRGQEDIEQTGNLVIANNALTRHHSPVLHGI